MNQPLVVQVLDGQSHLDEDFPLFVGGQDLTFIFQLKEIIRQACLGLLIDKVNIVIFLERVIVAHNIRMHQAIHHVELPASQY